MGKVGEAGQQILSQYYPCNNTKGKKWIHILHKTIWNVLKELKTWNYETTWKPRNKGSWHFVIF